MNIDLAAVFSGKANYADITRDLQKADLYTATDEYFDTVESILRTATDATILFVPHDPAASDQSEQGWTLGHIVAHLTASFEEPAAIAAMFARGVSVEGRLRYEVPWEELSTIQKVRARLQESHRMCHAFLDAWPDEPHLDVTINRIAALGPMNAIGYYVLGIAHAQGHLEQLREIQRQHLSSANH